MTRRYIYRTLKILQKILNKFICHHILWYTGGNDNNDFLLTIVTMISDKLSLMMCERKIKIFVGKHEISFS